jgi:perosamine synthetase
VKIQRTIPPAAAPIDLQSIMSGLRGIVQDQEERSGLENQLKAYFNVKHAYLVSSGKAALTLILHALKSISPEKKQVLIPAYTCFSVPAAIVKAGLEISLCDVDSGTFDFNYQLLSEAIGRETLCVVSTHLFGIPANLEKMRDHCKKENIFLVEDAAQAMGGNYKGELLGTIGDVGFFSLARGKNVTCGSGGIIVTNDDKIAAAIELRYSLLEKPRFLETLVEFIKVVFLAVFIRPSLYWVPAGLPFLKLGETTFDTNFPVKKLSGMKVGLLKNWQRRLEDSNRVREDNAEYLCKTIELNVGNEYPVPFIRLPLLVKNREIRDNIIKHARLKGMGINKMYPTAINEIREIQDRFYGKKFLSAKEIADSLVSVPTHPLLSDKDKARICGYLKNQRPVINSQLLVAESATYAH